MPSYTLQMVSPVPREGRPDDVTLPVRPPLLADLPLLGRLRFLAFGRVVPAVFFLSVAWLQANTLLGHITAVRRDPSLLNAGEIPHDIIYLLFCAIPVGIYLTRTVPRASDGSLAARGAALLGTTIVLIIGAVAKGGDVVWSSETVTLWVADPVLVVAFSFAVAGLLHLRRNLSLMPEARGLVTTGPYRIVRHPLYLAEITAALGFIISSATVVQLMGFVALVALQITRCGFEERLLRRTFPEYDAYAARTRRIIPGVW